MRRATNAVLILCLLAACTSRGDGSATETPAAPVRTLDVRASAKTWKFDDERLPDGFTVESGTWSMVEDADAPSPLRAVEQSAPGDAGAFHVLLGPRVDAVDIDVSVRLRAVAGETDRGGGVVWRARDAHNYYLARYNPLERNLRVYKVVEGDRKQLLSADVDAGTGWHLLACTMRRDAIECALDGRVLLRVRDSTFPEAGRVGLWTKADAVSRFDDLTVGPSL